MPEPNVLASIWHRRLLVAVFAVQFALLGAFYSFITPNRYAAEAGVLLSDPRLEAPELAADQLRYVADQVAIMRSQSVMERASAVARQAASGQLDSEDLFANASIEATEGSNFVVVRFEADKPEAAQAGANAIVEAYRSLQTADLAARRREEVERLERAISKARARISGGTEQPPDGVQAILNRLLDRQADLSLETALDRDSVERFQPADRVTGAGASTRSTIAVSTLVGALLGAALAAGIGARRREFLGPGEPEAVLGVPALAAIPNFRRDGLTSKLPTLHAVETRSANALRFLASSLMQPGTALGNRPASVEPAHDESVQRPAVPSRSVREAAADVDGILVDVRRAREGLRPELDRGIEGVRHHVVAAFVAASEGEGTTTLVANIAFAAAHAGLRVLAIDADVETLGLSHILIGQDSEGIETTEAAGAAGDRADAAGSSIPAQWVMGTRSGGTVSLLAPPASTGHTDGIVECRQLLAAASSVRGQFDLVIADVPPVLRMAYANAVLQSADNVVLVVRHRSRAGRLMEALDRLALIGIRPVGYVYNLTPSSRSKPQSRSRRTPSVAPRAGRSQEGTDGLGRTIARRR
ncbi:MAG: Wzz/FepE/Etk N-terminal domain-containing protein [Actinomycetota bacterium]|nr:Wzz/FepE/Etk N-terminal domain-containing protein [Actinomycetota bacterium]